MEAIGVLLIIGGMVFTMFKLTQHMWDRKAKRTERLLVRRQYTNDKFGDPMPIAIKVPKQRQ